MLKISVIIPTHNRSPQIGAAIESVQRQVYPVNEIVVVDDGSTDDTRSAVSHYIDTPDKSGGSVRYLYQQKQGVSAARNTGIGAATGDWIAFLDSDDRWLPDKLEWQVRALEKFGNRYGLCFTDAVHLNNSRWNRSRFEIVGHSFADTMGVIKDASGYVAQGDHGIYIQSVILRRDVIDQAGNFDTALRICEDNDFVFRASLHTEFAFVNKPLVEVDRTPGRPEGLMELYADEEFRLQQIEYEHRKWLTNGATLTPDLRQLIEKRLQGIHAGWASLHLMKNRRHEAIRAMTACLSYGPSVRTVIKWALVRYFPKITGRVITKRYTKALEGIIPGMRM